MTGVSKGRQWLGGALIGFALFIVGIEIALHTYSALTHADYDIDHRALLVALVCGFGGFYTLSPKGAKDGGQFLADNALRFMQVVRFGRRKTDPIGIQAIKTEESPVPPPVEGVTGGKRNG